MGAAGNTGNLYKKYKSKGLKVIAITANGKNDIAFLQKLKNKNAEFPAYTMDNNVFKKVRTPDKGFPDCVYVKSGKIVGKRGSTDVSKYEEDLINFFGF